MQCVRQAAYVVVGFDGVCLFGLGAGRFDDVRIDRALGQPFRIWQPGSFALKYLDELATDDLALALRIADVFERRHELRGCIHVNNPDTEIARKRLHDLGGFVQAQQAGIDEHAGQLRADGAMD